MKSLTPICYGFATNLTNMKEGTCYDERVTIGSWRPLWKGGRVELYYLTYLTRGTFELVPDAYCKKSFIL